jgi:hypothetical protein
MSEIYNVSKQNTVKSFQFIPSQIEEEKVFPPDVLVRLDVQFVKQLLVLVVLAKIGGR